MLRQADAPDVAGRVPPLLRQATHKVTSPTGVVQLGEGPMQWQGPGPGSRRLSVQAIVAHSLD